ncbi:MAG: phage tail tape measure protein [Rhodobiaceae bacterium]|nr:phage tail tape measure protein [Rhodobiaceae bacterium]
MAESNLKLNITGDSSKLKSALSSASSKLQSFGSKMQSVGKSMSTRLTLPLVAAGAAATKMAFDFDKSMSQIESLVGIAGDKVKEMGEAAKKMAVDTGRSANEAAEALFFITSAGLRGADATDTLSASLKAAAVGLGETKTIADLATSAMNAYGVENLNATGATDILVAAVREGKLEASELAGAMGGVIPIASNMGVGFDEVGAALAAMSRTGTNAANGATQLTAILASIKKPTEQSAEAMLALGTSQQEISQSLAERGLMPTLMDLSARLEQTGMDATAIFPNIRALKGVLDLTGKGAADNIKIFDALGNTMGATDEAFNKTSQTASFKVTQGLNAMKTSLLSIGQTILVTVAPAIQKIGAFMTNLSEKFNALSPTVKKMIVVFGGVVAALGPVIAIIGTLLTMAPAIGAALTLMTGPIGLVVAALTAVGVVIYKNWSGIKAALIKIGNYFIDLYNNSLPIQLAVDAIIMQFKNLVAVGKFVFSTLVTILKTAGKNIVSILGGVGDIIMGIFTFDAEKIKAGFISASKGIKDNMLNAFNKIKTDAKTLGSSVVDNFNEALEQKQIAPIVVPVAVVSAGDGGGQAAAGGGGGTTTTSVGGGGLGGQGRGTVSGVSTLESGGIMTPITNAIKADTAGIPAAMSEQQMVLAEQQAIAMENAAMFNNEIGNIITGGLNQLATGIGEALGQAISGGGNLSKKLAKVVLTTIGTMAVQMGKLAIAIGIGVEKIKIALKSLNPAVAIAAGIALVALGSFAKSQAGKIGSGGGATAFANGGIVSGPTMGLVGEYPGARQNPEVIAPLNKLQSMIGGGGQNINVGGQIRLEGQDLLIAIERANETADRLF